MNGYVYVGNNPVNFVDPLGLWAPSPYAVMHGKHPWEYGAWTGDALNDAMSQVADEVIPVRETVSAYQAGDYASLAWTFVSNFIKPLKLCPSFVTKGADETVDLYRAVAPVEFDDIAKTGTLNLGPSAFGKQFGYSFDEILKLSDHLPDTAAIMKVKVPKNALNGLDHTPVDRHILRSGSLTVQPEKLDQFNKAVQSIEHVF